MRDFAASTELVDDACDQMDGRCEVAAEDADNEDNACDLNEGNHSTASAEEAYVNKNQVNDQSEGGNVTS